MVERPSRRSGTAYQANTSRMAILAALCLIGFLSYQWLSYAALLSESKQAGDQLQAEVESLHAKNQATKSDNQDLQYVLCHPYTS